MMAIKKVIYLKISGEKHIIWVIALKNWSLPTQLIIFPDFLQKILKIVHPVNYSYLPPCAAMRNYDDPRVTFIVTCTSCANTSF